MKVRFIIFAGLGLILFSGIYHIIVINIPYQDPPPELIAERVRQYMIRDFIWHSGLGLFVIGLMIGLVKKLITLGNIKNTPPAAQKASEKNTPKKMRLEDNYQHPLPADYLNFLKANPEGTEITFNAYEDEDPDFEGTTWYMMGEAELLRRWEMKGVGTAMNFECLKLYIKLQREYAFNDSTASNVDNISLSRVEAGFVIGSENGDYLYLDPSDNFSVWIYYHDGGDVFRVADSFRELTGD
ncbi:MAG: hypothetical protein Roseis2KO_17280 [Roseivirga sp.]